VATGLALSRSLNAHLDKESCDFTREDMLCLCGERSIERFTFHYTAIDGQLKELQLPFGDLAKAERILAAGERVDGSSLFKGVMDVSESDLYVVPDYRTAFLNPFDSASLDFLCRFLDRDGNPVSFTPDNILGAAHGRIRRLGFELHALGELEFFLLAPPTDEYYVPAKQTGYQTSAPFFKCGQVVTEMVRHLEQITGAVKYAHAEVGFVDSVRSDNPVLRGLRAEQHEIELLTRPIEMMGDIVALAKWVIRNVAHRNGLLATFVPKLEEGIAGNGLHFHLELLRSGCNVMVDERHNLSESALRLIGGLVHYASTLTAFGNTVPAAYLRLVPNQEAPTRICWSDANRSALIRVPLGWAEAPDLAQVVNPQETCDYSDKRGRQTVELRSPDGSAHFHLLLAGIATAAEWGLSDPSSLDLARAARVVGNVFGEGDRGDQFETLPASCVAAGRQLLERRAMYEVAGAFPTVVIDYMARMLISEDDERLNQTLSQMTADERLHVTRQIMHRDIHKH
jgi:glutamine synthetase